MMCLSSSGTIAGGKVGWTTGTTGGGGGLVGLRVVDWVVLVVSKYGAGVET